jgi:hypothetical protein
VINFQLEALLQNATEEQAEALQLGYWSLVGDGPPPWLDKDDDPKSAPTGMGSQYKPLTIVSDACGNNTCHFYKILNMYFPQASHFLNSKFAYIFVKKCRNVMEQSPVLLQ